jgi:hypothetical protein
MWFPCAIPRAHVAGEAEWSYSAEMFKSLYQSFATLCDGLPPPKRGPNRKESYVLTPAI